jgi:hypothetical protein
MPHDSGDRGTYHGLCLNASVNITGAEVEEVQCEAVYEGVGGEGLPAWWQMKAAVEIKRH